VKNEPFHIEKKSFSEPEISEGLTPIVINEVQLILAEKRTWLASLRTGIAFFALPLSVLSLLIVTSKYYDVFNILYLLVPLAVISLALIVIGSFFTIRSIGKIRHCDYLIKRLKSKYGALTEFLD
jgi:uncharacterized membrane protein YidH (DUF202 family)